ncbi:MAG: hypothetical protein IKE43_10755 [Coriobacteriales bacterium]|nr:hypothetical protein [Coriobacteriales bacterium]
MNISGTGLLLGILLALIISLGSCVGIDTSQIEDTAADYGIVPIELSDVLGSFDYGTASNSSGYPRYEESDDDFDSIVITTVSVQTAQEAADGAGVGSFVAFEDLEGLSLTNTSNFYYYENNRADAIAFYDGIVLFVDKATYDYDGTVANDDRDFSLEWSQSINGISVDCYGYNKEEVCKATFTDGTYLYGIVAYGPDDNIEAGLSLADLAVLVNALVK